MIKHIHNELIFECNYQVSGKRLSTGIEPAQTVMIPQ